jgi:hypothetical protein
LASVTLQGFKSLPAVLSLSLTVKKQRPQFFAFSVSGQGFGDYFASAGRHGFVITGVVATVCLRL